MEELRSLLPGQWMDTFWLGLQILLILVAAFVLQRIVARGLSRLGQRYPLPPELLVPVRGGLRWLIMGSALLFVLERLGVSATVLWTALSGFVAVAAGTRVAWVNGDDITHTVTSGTPEQRDGRFNVVLDGKGARGAVQFREPGVHQYFCDRHRSMRGEIRVN